MKNCAERRLLRALLLSLAAALAGCASGPKYAEVKNTIPELREDLGRIYFYRSSALGAAVVPSIRLNGQVVGDMTPLGFFYVDRQPGMYVVSAVTEAEATERISLEANQTRYVRCSITLGFFLGRPQFELVDTTSALAEIQDLSFVGTSASGGAVAPVVGAQPVTAPAESKAGTSMKDLEGLLPGGNKK